MPASTLPPAAIALLLACVAAVAPRPAAAQEPAFPSRPVRLIVPFATGGPSDIVARMIAPRMTQVLGQAVVVESRPGAGGVTGVDVAAKAPPDGHTVALGSAGGLAISPGLQPSMPYDALRDLAPLTLAVIVHEPVVVPAAMPWRTLGDMLAEARARPGRLNYGSTGPGSMPHLAGELIRLTAGVDITHVPYRGVAPATTALLGGDIQMMFDTVPQAMPQIRGGALRPLAVTTARRVAALPEVPTVAEAGVAGYESSSWFGVVAPAGTPAAVVARLADAVAAALRQPEVVARFAEQGGELEGMGPEAFAAFIRAEREKWTAVVQASGARLD